MIRYFRLYLLLFCAAGLSFSCFNFRMTKRVSGTIRGEEYDYRLDSLKSAKLSEEHNVLTLEATIRRSRNGAVETKTGCGKYDLKNPIKNVKFRNCDSSQEIPLEIRELSKSDAKKSAERKKSIRIGFLSRDEEYAYYEIALPDQSQIPDRKYEVSKFEWIETKYRYAAVYPISFTYDLVAGTIHTIGAPFAVICFIGLAIGGKQPGNRNAFETGVAFCALPFCTVYKGFAFLDGGKLD